MTRLLRILIAVAAALGAPWTVLAADAGTDVEDAEPAPLVDTSDLGALSLRHVHVVLERKGDRIEVSELLTFTSREGTRFSAPAGVRVALPPGAVAPRTSDGEGELLAAAVEAEGFVVTGPIGQGGDDLSVTFEVPIADGAVSFEQPLPVGAASFQVISTWTREPARLSVRGASKAVKDELKNGLVALIAMGRAAEVRTLSVSLTGIRDGADAWPRRVALASCVALFAAGAIAFVRRRKRRGEAL